MTYKNSDEFEERLRKHKAREEYLSPDEEADLLMEILSDNNDGDSYSVERERHMSPIIDAIEPLGKKIYDCILSSSHPRNSSSEMSERERNLSKKDRRNTGLNLLVAITNLIFKHYDIRHCEGGYSYEGIEEDYLDELKKYWKLNKNDIKTQYASELRLIHLKRD